jgi:hypothetical protein
MKSRKAHYRIRSCGRRSRDARLGFAENDEFKERSSLGDAIIPDRVNSSLDIFAILLERHLCSKILANPSRLLLEAITNCCITWCRDR